MANWTSVKLSDLMRQKTLRMDAKYWIQKALLKKRKKELEKKKAWAGIQSAGRGEANVEKAIGLDPGSS